MNWGIIVDSGSDIIESFLPLNNIGFESAPLKIITDEKEFVDDNNIDIVELLHAMKKSSKSSSACPNVDEFREAMLKYDNCICITITSALSGSYNAACVAKEMVNEDHTFMHWRRKWQPTPVFLPGESQGREPGGLPSMGLHRVRLD